MAEYDGFTPFNENEEPFSGFSEPFGESGGPLEFEPPREWDGQDHDEDDISEIPAPREFFFDVITHCLKMLKKMKEGETPTFGDFFCESGDQEEDGENSEESEEDKLKKVISDNLKESRALDVHFEETLKEFVLEHRSRTVGTAIALKLREELQKYADDLIAGFIDDIYLTLMKESHFSETGYQSGFALCWSPGLGGLKLELPSTLALDNPGFIYLTIGDMLLELADRENRELHKS